MQGSVEGSGETPSILKLTLPFHTPVIGLELVPNVEVRGADGRLVEAQETKFNWYRERDEELVTCSVHPNVVATFQCISCVMLGIPAANSYHCTVKCFSESWPLHRAHHAVVSDKQNWGYWHSDDGSRSNFVDETAEVVEISGKSWLPVGCLTTYVPAVEDIGHVLRLECVVGYSVEGILYTASDFLLTDRVIAAPMPCRRRMIQVGSIGGFRSVFSSSQPSVSRTFTVLTYNVLADLYATAGANDCYSYCKPWALSWQYRRKNLLQEIIKYDADIVCLQEVQSNHFEEYFAPNLKRQGYSVIYKKKSSTVYAAGKDVCDGCATFFRQDRFKEVEKHEIEFFKTAQPVVSTLPLSKRGAAARHLMKDNVAVVVVLESKEEVCQFPSIEQPRNRQLICVANAHIQFNPKLTDVKLLQTADLLLRVERISGNATMPVLICGDFNSVPGSAAHDLVVSGKVDPYHREWKVDPYGLFRQKKLSHSMPLVSAYASFFHGSSEGKDLACQRMLMDSSTYEPLFTNFTNNFVGTLDYIFYTANSLIVDSLLELLDEQFLRRETALPSSIWPSDHIALMARFRFGGKALHAN